MKKIKLLALFLLLPALTLLSQENGQKTILKVGDDAISMNEFKTIYFKNNKDSVVTQEDLEQYMQLFIDFKLKVKEAQKMGLDTSQQFQKEFERYRDQLAEPYFIDSTAMEELMKEAYERTKQEVHAAHILVRLPDDPSPEDTAKAWERVQELKDEVEAADGELLEVGKEAEEGSEKISASDLGYFSAFRMVYPFENLAYETEVGSVGGPVRTRFGYHLIKVQDKRPSAGQLQAAHILKHVPRNAGPEREKKAEERIRKIHDELEEGAEFSTLARKHSDDDRSARRGGRLPWFQSGDMVPEFSEAAFSLDSNGQVSDPVKTRYGWHLIKRIDHKDLKSFEEMKPELEKELKESDRFQKVERGVVRRLRDKYDVKTRDGRLKKLAKKLPDTAFTAKEWKESEPRFAEKTLFTIADEEIPTQRLVERIGGGKAPSGDKEEKLEELKDELRTLIDEEVKAYHKKKLPEKSPRYKALLQEYHDGILLFELMEKKVWKKALEDTIGLKEFYEENKKDYRWNERLDLTYFNSPNKESAERIQKMLKEGKSSEAVRSAISSGKEFEARMDSGAYEKEEHPFLEQMAWEEGVSSIVEENGRYIVGRVHEVLPSKVKELDEARGIVSSDYQDHLEEQWIDQLREEYRIDVNEELLQELAEQVKR